MRIPICPHMKLQANFSVADVVLALYWDLSAYEITGKFQPVLIV